MDEPRLAYGECGPMDWTGSGGELYSVGGGKAKVGVLYEVPGLSELCGEVWVGGSGCTRAGEAWPSMPCS